jgi:nicotinate-nucleotide--dimethylbenzimidazole phosphoribosyltransferase
VQNLWLAARAEGIGIGWVSIVEPAVLRAALALPAGVEPIAYLCVGYPIAFRAEPMLEETGWRARRPLVEVVHPGDRWDDSVGKASDDGKGPFLSGIVAAPALASVPPADEAARAAAITHHAKLAKPIGSLGRLEELSVFYAAARGAFPPPPPERAAVVVFAADHGVAAEGVSAYGSQLTAAVVGNAMAGGSAINAIAQASRAELLLVDVGIAGDRSAFPVNPVVKLRDRRVKSGTRNFRREQAMDRAGVERALEAGGSVVAELAESGLDLLAVGEIGIANTTAAAALACVFSGADPDDVVGPGTGVDPAVRARKVQVVADALALHQLGRDGAGRGARDPMSCLAAVGGLESVALVGAMLEAARRRIPVILDGFVTHSAALAAVALDEHVRGYLLASHGSAEPGSRVALAELRLVPLLDWGLRLGEGTGAALAIPLLRAAVHTELSMATFATAGVVGRAGTELPR